MYIFRDGTLWSLNLKVFDKIEIKGEQIEKNDFCNLMLYTFTHGSGHSE